MCNKDRKKINFNYQSVINAKNTRTLIIFASLALTKCGQTIHFTIEYTNVQKESST